MVQVFGKHDCVMTDSVKAELSKRGVQFEYSHMSQLTESRRNYVQMKAQSNRKMGLPLIMVDGRPFTAQEFLNALDN